MRSAIIANPKAGFRHIDQTRLLLKQASRLLNARIFGLDTTSAEELAGVACDLSRHCEVLVVAGGDGTFANIVNAIYPAELSLAFLPLGTGNAIQRALGYRGGLVEIAKRIRSGQRHAYDLIRCDDGRLAFMTSLGLDGTAVRLWTRYRQRGYTGRKAYFLASLQAYFNVYKPGRARLSIDNTDITIERLMSLLVVKQPFFGLGMKVVPHARWDDGYLHALWIPAAWHQPLVGLVTSLTVGNRAGTYGSGKTIRIESQRPLTIQLDGELGWEAKRFSFDVLTGVLGLTH